MSPADILFWLVGAGIVAGAAGVAFTRNVLHSALSLLATLLGVGALYVYLAADFLAVTQLLIYVGGVLVLILFAIMLTQRIDQRQKSNPARSQGAAAPLLVAMLGGFGFLSVGVPWGGEGAGEPPATTAERIGDLFLGHYLLVFEVLSLLLLATLVAAVVVARKELKE